MTKSTNKQNSGFETLDSLIQGERGIIKELLCTGLTRRRFMDMGLVNGTEVEVIMKSLSGDPVAYRVKGTQLAIRNEDAHNIIIERIENNGRIN
ncbi:ferrous iron transport protein A [candidate division KSB1 bacterium]|nr:ferrous iron transport protein A [candidate division KSB1 bacterium]MCH8286640.1 ferrous iron transport protein A [candidate division KSB1 bacterium]